VPGVVGLSIKTNFQTPSSRSLDLNPTLFTKGEIMNVSALTLPEILRTVEPETDLEKRLFSFLTDSRYVDLNSYECPDCKDMVEKDELEDCENERDSLQRSRNAGLEQAKEAMEQLKEAIELL